MRGGELRDGARLPDETRGQLGRGSKSEIENLDRDRAVLGLVFHAEYGGEATFAQQGAHPKFVSESLLQACAEPGEIQRHGGRKT